MIGQKLSDRYEIVSELGRGGMGVVYRARDPRLNRDVAIKLIPPSMLSKETEARFEREAQVVAQMDHPSIVPIYDYGHHESSLFFVMPVVEGTNLHAFLRQEPVLGDVIDVGIQVAEALDYSHAREVIHRDIKPENIMVSREGGGIRVRVMDFGLARAATETRLTKSGTLLGTLCYLSPEQVVGKGIDHRSDIYSLGCVLYECVVGEPPFSGETQSVLYRIVHEHAPPPSTLGAAVDSELEEVILSCLHKEAAKRPPQIGEVAEALKRYRSGLRDSDKDRSLTGFTRTFQAHRAAHTPFVGRSKEFAELQTRLNAAVAGECQLVVVSGEPGIGKTRLLDELDNLANARKIMVLHGRAVEQDSSFPYQGFCELIQDYFRRKEDSTTSPPDFGDIASDLVTLFPMLSEIGEIRSASTGDSMLSRTGEAAGPENRIQIFELLARTLTRIAAGRPMVLILEDLHGAEVSNEALQYIVRRLGPTPTLIVGSYRSTEIDRRHTLTRVIESFRGDRRYSSITLGSFTPSEHRSFLETLVAGAKVSDGLVERLYDGTEGNPFFTKELVRSLVDAGRISRDETGDWSLSAEAGIAMDELPATIQQAVEKRIEGLPDDTRDILSIASVLGKSFDSRDLEVLAEGKGDLDDALDRLVADGYLEEKRESRGNVLAFSSGVVRDVLYGGLSRRKRRSYHRKCAELIEKRHAGRLDRVLPQLVHHCSHGDVPEKTVEYGLQLAQTSLDAFSPEEAARSAKMALEFLDEEWEGDRGLEGDARVILAQAERMSGNIDGALKEAAHAIRIFENENQLSRAVDTFRLAAETAWQARRSDETSRWVEKGLSTARGSEESDTMRHLLSLAATLANLRGEYDKANEFLNEVAQLDDSKVCEPADEVPVGGRLVVAMANPINAKQPVEIRLLEEEEILSNVFETLVTTDAEGHLVAALCEKWELADKGKSLRLQLRQDVRFQDGAPLKASDVKTSFETAMHRLTGETPAAFVAIQGWEKFTAGDDKELSGIVVHSDYELEFRLHEPLPIYPSLLSHTRTGIARTVVEDGKETIVGTGPFRMTSHERGNVVLERVNDHWKKRRPSLDRIDFRCALSAKDIAGHFRSGAVDLARDLLPEDLEEILRDPRYRQRVVEVAKKNTYFVLFNTLSGPMAKNLEVRRALSGVIHTRELVWRTLGSFAQPAACLIPPGMLGHDPGRRAHALTNEEARKVLDSCGIELPLRLKASVHPLIQDRYGSLLTDLLSTWSEIGVEISIETSEINDYLKSWKENEGLDLSIGRWNADYDDPDNFTFTLFHSHAGGLKRYFSSEESDQILEEARSAAEPKRRESSYRKFENLLVETRALLPLFHDVDYRLAGSKVTHLKLRGSAPYVNYQEIGRRDLSKTDPEVRWTARGTIQVPIAGAVHSLDPNTSDTVEQGEATPSIYECLLHAKGGTRMVPWLAAEFKAEKGGKLYRFRLRDDVRFHDGRRLTVRDVRYSFERILQNQECKDRWFMAPIRGAKEVLDGKAKVLSGFRIHSATEFSIELEEPVGFFPALVAWQVTAIIPEGSDPGRDKQWIGTGPFRVVNFEPGKRLELERNKAYWRKGYPRSAGLVYSFGVPPKDMLTGFREGRFAMASDLFPSDAEALRREPEFASGYHEIPQLITYFIGFNLNRGPLKDRILRQRLIQALDVRKIIRQTLGQLSIPATSLIPPGLLGHDPHASSLPSDESETISSEIELTAGIHPLFFDKHAALYKELTAAWSKVGVKVRVINSSMEELMSELEKANADIFVGRWSADYPDSDTFLYLLHTTSPFLGKVCGTKEIDRLAEKGRVAGSPSARHSLYREFEELLEREAIVLPLFYEQAYRFARPELDGLSLSVGNPTVNYADLQLRD